MIQIEESNPSFESCSDCIHSDDSEEICILRRCIHAVAQLNECYVPKQPTIELEIVRCKDCKHQVKEWRDDKRLKDKGYWAYGCKVISDICGYWAWFGQDDEFCSEAERKTDE